MWKRSLQSEEKHSRFKIEKEDIDTFSTTVNQMLTYALSSHTLIVN